jgi:hypothetical protein
MRRQLEWLRYTDFYYLTRRDGSQAGRLLLMISTDKKRAASKKALQ